MPARVYDLRVGRDSYNGVAAQVTLEPFRAFGVGKEYSIDLATIFAVTGSGNSFWIVEKHIAGVTVGQIVYTFADGETARIPGPYHFNGSENGDEFFTLRNFVTTVTLAVCTVFYSEE